MTKRPVVGITPDLLEQSGRLSVVCAMTYIEAVKAAGGLPVVLSPALELVGEHVALCDAFVFTGGADPRTEQWGMPTHSKASPMHPQRQAFETALLEVLRKESAEVPVLGVCLGMQLMSLDAGGRMDQYLPETLGERAAAHYDREHRVESLEPGPIVSGIVHSRHRQAVVDAGRLKVIARAPDEVIEAVRDPARRFYLGVQWHPERTMNAELGARIFEQLVEAASG